MDFNGIISRIRKDLDQNLDLTYKRQNQKFFKEKIKCRGIRTPIVRKIARKHFKNIKYLQKEEQIKLIEKLFKSGYNEEATIAIQWTAGILERFKAKEISLFEDWLNQYIDNWAKDDDFCSKVIHPMLKQYPKLNKRIKSWTDSGNLWTRRAAAVSFISHSREFYSKRQNLKDIFEIAQKLLKDKEDLVQKGYGWMLKSAYYYKPGQVFRFILENKKDMPRTALRYAIEKMPPRLKQEAMGKD
ncbi:MAG: DNA alkylation repair protein [Candidatus Moranbacteria bacterium]|nr:DNA alkylation repair protein [Candidatus Moranbacteria bacterium]